MHQPPQLPASLPRCPDCGALLPPIAAGFCPACLLSEQAPPSHPQIFDAQSLQLPYRLGDYCLHHKLGEGGMGLVFEAEHLPSHRRVALKVLKNPLENEEQTKRFLREGRLAATIEHARSIYVFSTDEIDGLPVIAMELASGGTLADEVKRRGPLPLKDAVDAILDVLDGLKAAHACGVLHRDMKPSNCFLSSDGRVWVGDYGLSISQHARADAGEPLTRSGLFMGTPAFAAPEQIRGEALDLRADLYSTGATLFFLLTGKPPVQGGTPMEIIAAVLEGRLLDLRALRPDLPAEFASVLKRCLAQEPSQRFENHEAFQRALEPFSSTTPALAPLSMRSGAYLVDAALVVLVLIPALSRLGIDLNENSTGLLEALLLILLFSVAESVWGTTPGKFLLGLRVTGLEGHRAGWGRVLLRSLLFFAPAPILISLAGFFFPALLLLQVAETPVGTLFAGVTFMILADSFCCVYFLSALWRPEQIAWHDRLTKTRVFLKATPAQRPAEPHPRPAPASEGAPTQPLWGPYQPAQSLSTDQRFGWDPVLHRRVLLHLRSEGGEPSSARKACSRPGRLRWLQSVVDPDGQIWEAWQSPPGKAWKEAIQLRAPNWSQTLGWMQELTSEFREALEDGTLPQALTPEHLWVTPDGQLLLLDLPLREARRPSLNPAGSEAPACVLSILQDLLLRIAEACPSTDRPLHADAILESLRSARFDSLTCLAGTLAHLKSQRTRVHWPARAALIALPFAYLIDMALHCTRDDELRLTLGKSILSQMVMATGILAILAALTCLLQGLWILAMGSPLLLRLSGLCLVSKTERPASRLLLLWRLAMGWGLALIMTLALCLIASGLHLWVTDKMTTWGVSQPGGWIDIVLGVTLLAILSTVVVNLLRPGRSYLDRIAGTWLVPR